MNMYTPEPWMLNENNNWKTNPFSVTVRKRGVHSTTVANIPTRMTIPPQEQRANARLIAAAPALLRYLEIAVDTIKGEYPEEQWPDYKVPEMEKLIAHVKTSNR